MIKFNTRNAFQVESKTKESFDRARGPPEIHQAMWTKLQSMCTQKSVTSF